MGDFITLLIMMVLGALVLFIVLTAFFPPLFKYFDKPDISDEEWSLINKDAEIAALKEKVKNLEGKKSRK